MWIKSTLLIMFALIIDGLQALIGLGVSVIAAFPGTVGGAVGGCVAGQQVAGSLGCSIGGFVLGILGTVLPINGLLTPATIPLGMAIGFTIDVCLSLTLGSGLIFVLFMFGMFYPKYVWSGSIAEFLPGFDILPGWTAMVVLSILEKSKEERGVLGTVAGVATLAASPSGINIASTIGRAHTMKNDIAARPANDNQPSYAQQAA
jgi:hypothetical protein